MTDTTNTLPKYSDMMYKLMQEQDTFDSNVVALYQEFTPTTAAYPTSNALGYLLPALAEEVGEFCGVHAKQVRKGGDPEDSEFMDRVIAEMGDIMYMISELCNYYGFDLDMVMYQNMCKLEGRAARGTIVGEGDSR